MAGVVGVQSQSSGRGVVRAGLRDEIRVEHEAAQASFRSTVEHAIRCGELLIEAKSQVRHGDWLPWLVANFPASEDTASNYMRLARHSERVRNVGIGSIRGALAALASPRDIEPEPEDDCHQLVTVPPRDWIYGSFADAARHVVATDKPVDALVAYAHAHRLPGSERRIAECQALCSLVGDDVHALIDRLDDSGPIYAVWFGVLADELCFHPGWTAWALARGGRVAAAVVAACPDLPAVFPPVLDPAGRDA